MASVKELLDDLVTGRASLAEVVADFGSRTWPPMPESTMAEDWGVTDAPVGSAESWFTVQNDPRLTSEQYQALGAAYRKATGR